MNLSDYNNILHTRKLATRGGSRQSVSNLVPVSSNDQEWIFRPECRKSDDHSLGEHCQFAVVTKVSRPPVHTTKSVLCEPVCSLFELTSSFCGKFPFSLWVRSFKWCKINTINFCFSQCHWEIFGCHWKFCINIDGNRSTRSEKGIWLGRQVCNYFSKFWSLRDCCIGDALLWVWLANFQHYSSLQKH